MPESLLLSRKRSTTDYVLALTTTGAALLVVLAFGWLVVELLLNGLPQLSLSFLTQEPIRSGRSGGIAPVIVSTLLILAICMAISLPLGLGTSLLLTEICAKGPPAEIWIRRSLDVLAGVPSIVFGLFGNVFFCVFLGMGFSILSGGLTLACMVLPILIRSTEEGLRLVPQDYRLAAAALGMSRFRTLWNIILPSAIPGLLVGIVLGIGRALAETAALIFTSGYVSRYPGSVMDSGRALSVHIYDLAMNIPGGNANAYASALVLLLLILAINLVAILISDRWRKRQTRQ